MAQLVFLNGSAATTPSTGEVSVYAKTDKKLYYKDDTGTETLIGGGGSALPVVTQNIISTPITILADTSYTVIDYLTILDTFTVVGNVLIL